jgi:predicted outer membrane repeat protein
MPRRGRCLHRTQNQGNQVEEVSEVLFLRTTGSEPLEVESYSEAIRELEAQSELHGLFDELFEGLNTTTTFEENKGGNEGAALYAAVASISG